LSASASQIVARDGATSRASSAAPAIAMPGMQ
jgi:hypothetical protein